MVVLRPLLLVQLALSLTIVVVELPRSRSVNAAQVPRLLFVSAVILPAAVLLSAMVSDDRWLGAGGAATALALSTTSTATALVARDRAAAKRLLRWLVAGTTVAAVIGLVVFANGGDLLATSRFSGDITRLGLRPRLTRPWGHANVAAMAIGSALVIAMADAAQDFGARSALASQPERQPERTALLRWLPWRLVVCLVLAVSLVLTYSRGGLAGAFVAIVIGGWFLLFHPPRTETNRRPATVLVSVVVVAVGLTMVLASGWRDRVVPDGGTRDFSAAIEGPAQLDVDQETTNVPLVVGNTSDRVWPAAGADRVELSARWLVAGSRQVAAEQRWPLPRDVGPGDTVTLTVGLDAAVIDGEYNILWDLLVDREAYFLQFSGLASPTSATVTNSSISSIETVPLVTPRTNLTRAEIWRIATDAFRSNPLLGVGPMQLLAYAEPDLEDNKRLPGADAHNLVLEALATWGLVGTVPLLVILIGGAWRAFRSARRGEPVGLAVLLGLIAFAVQSMVEWQVDEVSAAIPLAILVGIGWSPVTEMASPG